MFLYKNLFFFDIYSFNPNHAYWNERRLFSGILPGMFMICFLFGHPSPHVTKRMFAVMTICDKEKLLRFSH